MKLIIICLTESYTSSYVNHLEVLHFTYSNNQLSINHPAQRVNKNQDVKPLVAKRCFFSIHSMVDQTNVCPRITDQLPDFLELIFATQNRK